MITLSCIKADIGGYVGHSAMHPDVLAAAQEELEKAHPLEEMEYTTMPLMAKKLASRWQPME